MKLMVLILNRIDSLELLLSRFAEDGIGGATILNSTGMARALVDYGEYSFFGSLKALLDPSREENRTILTVLKEDQIAVALKAIEETVGSLDRPDTVIVFTLPDDFVKGLGA